VFPVRHPSPGSREGTPLCFFIGVVARPPLKPVCFLPIRISTALPVSNSPLLDPCDLTRTFRPPRPGLGPLEPAKTPTKFHPLAQIPFSFRTFTLFVFFFLNSRVSIRAAFFSALIRRTGLDPAPLSRRRIFSPPWVMCLPLLKFRQSLERYWSEMEVLDNLCN